METYVVHFYLTVNQVNPITTNDRFFKLDSYPIAGLVRPTLSSKEALPFKIRPFEIQQDNLYLLIKSASKFKTVITKIEFEESIDQDLNEEIMDCLRDEKTNQLSLLIDHLQMEEMEIKAISFYFKSRQYRITKHAVAEITAEWEEIPFLTESTPLAFITGIKGFPTERLECH